MWSTSTSLCKSLHEVFPAKSTLNDNPLIRLTSNRGANRLLPWRPVQLLWLWQAQFHHPSPGVQLPALGPFREPHLLSELLCPDKYATLEECFPSRVFQAIRSASQVGNVDEPQAWSAQQTGKVSYSVRKFLLICALPGLQFCCWSHFLFWSSSGPCTSTPHFGLFFKTSQNWILFFRNRRLSQCWVLQVKAGCVLQDWIFLDLSVFSWQEESKEKMRLMVNTLNSTDMQLLSRGGAMTEVVQGLVLNTLSP